MMNGNIHRNENKVSQYNKYSDHKKPIKVEVAAAKNGDRIIRKTANNKTQWNGTKVATNKPIQQFSNGRFMHNTRKALK